MSDKKALSNGCFYLDIGEVKDFYQIGYIHGETFKKEIRECIRLIKNEFGDDIKRVWQIFFHESTYVDDIKKYLPDVFEEFRGVCEGSGVEMNDLLILNCLDECYTILTERDPIGKCTAFGIRNDKSNTGMIGQNLDFMEMFDGYQTIFRIKSPLDGKVIVQYGFAGQIFGMGQNSEGLSVVSTTLINGSINLFLGVPNTFVQKAILYCNSTEEAVKVLKKCPVSTATSWIISDNNELMCIETTANKVEVSNNRQVYTHTNHALYSSDIRSIKNICDLETFVVNSDGYTWEQTVERLECINKKINVNTVDAIDVEYVKSTLLKEPVFRNYQSKTLASVICTRENEKAYVYCGGSRKDGVFLKIEVV